MMRMRFARVARKGDLPTRVRNYRRVARGELSVHHTGSRAQIRAITWWTANRSADELAHCLELLRQKSENLIGGIHVRGLRRVLLRATRYHVYYVADGDAVAVLAVWHSRRGQRPPLEEPLCGRRLRS